MLCVPERKEKLYTDAFLDIFPSQYTPHIGDVERLANKRTRKLYVTLSQSYHWLSHCGMKSHTLHFFENENGEIFQIQKES